MAPGDGLSALELERQARIQQNKQRMEQLGLKQAVQDLHGSQQGAAPPPPRRRAPVERVLLTEADLRRSKR